MEGSLSFSILNERLRPYSTLERLRAPPSIWERRASEPQESKAPSEEVAGDDSETGSLDSEGWSAMNEDQGDRSDLLSLLNQCLVPSMRTTTTEYEKDGEPAGGQDGVPDAGSTADGTMGSTPEETGQEVDPQASAQDKGSHLQRSYTDRTLPDLIRGSGRPLSRRRTLGPVSDTLKEVRREVELSRRRSIRLKAQVDKLQENSDGPGWSQHRERVTEELLSILRLLHPLTNPPSRLAEVPSDANQLDAVLSQLQSTARKLATHHGTPTSGVAKRTEDMAILEQALRDRDEAIERKKGMEAELLRSKTEMMSLNNQLLEAVQKRLELSLELEAWKEDLQIILQQQLQQQQQQSQQAEQAQKKTRLGILKRSSPVQRLPTVPTSAKQTQRPQTPPPSKPLPSQGFGSISRGWKDKFRRGKIEQVGQGIQKDITGFQTVSLD
ncbi:hypothetical protein NHX12_009745 [Muraenolepis orangiensis]|uniref:BICD family-like cargo adapter 1 n=1 Tax=Muraenolepis orangiensis TaxID=630683 RepID=A0A9Q0DID4_9TELE|nr:hypothetical protein NHX12_009745 [Muraenolepis orangiensis]